MRYAVVINSQLDCVCRDYRLAKAVIDRLLDGPMGEYHTLHSFQVLDPEELRRWQTLQRRWRP